MLEIRGWRLDAGACASIVAVDGEGVKALAGLVDGGKLRLKPRIRVMCDWRWDVPGALLSVWDKTGIVELARELHACDWTLIASGGTARTLREAELPVREVSEVTGEPEMFDGRVKTLHPAIHAGLLARDSDDDRATLDARGWAMIDLVVVNLYPFEDVSAKDEVTLGRAIEYIDIGGVALLRGAAKNFQHVTALCEPADYSAALENMHDMSFRMRMARKAFARTAAYDAAIAAYLARACGSAEPLRMTLYPSYALRYGENPHQEAMYYSSRVNGAPLNGELLQGKPLSYNNLLDLDAAWRAVGRFDEAAVAIVKHLSPCGIASGKRIADVLSAAIASDTTSAFGSVIACNREVNASFVEALGDMFVECVVAPGFSAEALSLLSARKNLRVLNASDTEINEKYEWRSIIGGVLRQSVDAVDADSVATWRVVSVREPSVAEFDALRFAWHACQPVKSNAIVLARAVNGMCATVGIGGGQPNRVDCVRIAATRAGSRARGAVMASDAFFPFADGVEVAAAKGVLAVIQPGGSVRDQEVIDAANAAGMAMVFTGVRHFRH